MYAASYRGPPSDRTVLTAFLARLATDASFWWRAAIGGFVALAVFTVLSLIDPRLLNGAVVWEKPANFMLSFIVHVLTFAWAFALMPEAERRSPLNRRLSIAFVACFAFEVAYMAFRAARGEASHFNNATPTAAILFALMGIAAVCLTVITAWFGWRLIRTRSDLAARAAGTGLMLGALLGTLAGAYLSAQYGHWVGGAASDAAGLPLFRWSTEDHVGHTWMVIHFLITGYLFAQTLVGIDPIAGRPPYPLRLLLLLATMAMHAFFGLSLVTGTGLLLSDWYGAMGRTWGPPPSPCTSPGK